MYTLHVVSHTHWDREWYLTFEQFRLKLIHLIDGLLAILETDSQYRHFMLDGQTVVLDDYLLLRPERAEQIRRHVQAGRLLIGPWHILPDEFLVSPEATIRNLLQGARTARRFGPRLMAGYLPDQFGHIGQMPQILRGFGMDTAIVWRGMDAEPNEVWWQAPDGSRVFTAHLRGGYAVGSALPTGDPERFAARLGTLRDELAPHATAPHVLIMHGNDHMEPPPDTGAALAYAQSRLGGDELLHSTLPAFLAAALAEGRAETPAPTVTGELRACRRQHLLPGVLSARLRIKQRNHACEILLEKWAEPFSVWAGAAGAATPERVADPAPILRETWRRLMECHPHDSICGCSIDQVHREMRVRFDQVEQTGEELTRQSLDSLAAAIDTAQGPGALCAVVVFNPTAGPRRDRVTATLPLGENAGAFEIVDAEGAIVPHDPVGHAGRDFANVTLDREDLRSALEMIQESGFAGMIMRAFDLQREGSTLRITVTMAESGEPNAAAVAAGMREIERALADVTISTYAVRVRLAGTTTVSFVAAGVPGHGYRTYWARQAAGPTADPGEPIELGGLMRVMLPLARRLARLPLVTPRAPGGGLESSGKPPYRIENEFLAVEASPRDGTLTVLDKRTGRVYPRLNRFVDGGDCGDEYNYSPPAADRLITGILASVRTEHGAIQSHLHVALRLRVPAGLTADRRARSARKVVLAVETHVTLAAGVPRVEILTEIDNRASDHRLRVCFPAAAEVEAADYDGHFEVVRRPIGLPAFDDTWIEQPRPESPQRAFVDVSDGESGLMIANRGLPEVEVGGSPTEIRLTLLRCVGWLSRDDFATRKGHAGPMIATPEAQMPGRHVCEYAIIPHSGTWRDAFREAYAFNAPLRAAATPAHGGTLPAVGAMLECSPDGFVISAVKAAEDGEGWIVRGYNLGDEPIEVTLRPRLPCARAARVNLAEEQIEPLVLNTEGGVTFPVAGHGIVTVKLWG